MTHAINALNYLASSEFDERLVLWVKDKYLQCHLERAALEGNNELYESILSVFPNASYQCTKREKADGTCLRVSLRVFSILCQQTFWWTLRARQDVAG
jgi:hypothetical protein